MSNQIIGILIVTILLFYTKLLIQLIISVWLDN